MNKEQRDVVGVIILNKKNEILLQKKTLDFPIYPGGYWFIFGGEMEEGETPKQTIRRELLEETGIELGELEYVKSLDYTIGDGYKGKMHIFKTEFKGEISDISLTEGAGFAFIDKSELDDIKIWEMNKALLKEFFDSLENNNESN